jgi:hypothetical protein
MPIIVSVNKDAQPTFTLDELKKARSNSKQWKKIGSMQ